MRANTKTRGKIAVLCAVIFLGAGVPAFSQSQPIPDVGELTVAMDAFAASMALALPFNASMGLNWSDAYIGRLFPSRRPHFGFGVVAGATTMDISPIDNLLNLFGSYLPDDVLDMGIGLPIPGAMAEIRLGGLFRPFDIGFKIGMVPDAVIAMLDDMTGDALTLDYFIIGGDFRYALVEAGRIIPAISLGVGFTHMRGGISVDVGDIPIGFTIPGHALGIPDLSGIPDLPGYFPGTLTIHNPQMGLEWSTNVIDMKLHVSRPLFIITPYVGLGVSHGWSRVSYGAGVARVSATVGDHSMDIDEVAEIFSDAGIDVTETSFSSEVGINGWGFRAFGGVSLNLAVFRLDFTGMYNFRDGNFGATVGFRFQL